jgi:glycosyltransferase involved in cell wall biosynthesis
MAMDIPLLVSDLPALVEIVADEQAPRGLSYKAEDATDLARVAAQCLRDATGTQQRVRHAAEWVRRERTWSANGRNFVAAYEQAEHRFAGKAVRA